MVSLGRAVFWWETARFRFPLEQGSLYATGEQNVEDSRPFGSP